MAVGLSKIWRSWIPALGAAGQEKASDIGLQAPYADFSYSLAQDSSQIDKVFARLQEYCYGRYLQSRRLESGGSIGLFWEAGKLEEGRPYFFIKLSGEIGWLFERSGSGWVIARSEKITHQDLFLRRHEPWDYVNVYMSEVHLEHSRVRAGRSGNHLISFLLYRRLAFEEIVSPGLLDWPLS